MSNLVDPNDAGAADAAPTLVQKLAAEAIGTLVLVVIGCGAAIMSGNLVAIGFAFGLAIVMMAYAFGRISGGHFNPAVSVGAALAGRIAWKDAAMYIGAQFVGGLLGGLILLVLAQGISTYDVGNSGLGQNGYGDYSGLDYAWWAAFLLELLLTAIFVTVILAVTDERNDTVAFAPLVIGLTLAAIHFVAINATGTSVNPARSLGPAIFSFDGDSILQQWVFLIAPVVGAAVAGVLYPLLFGRGAEPVPGSGLGFGGRAQAGAPVPGFGAPNAFEQQWNQQAGGYAAPGAGAPAAGAAAPGTEQPIIQDGWQWDPARQEWIPAQQPGDPSGGHTAMRPPGY